jgi:hypothetical protein
MKGFNYFQLNESKKGLTSSPIRCVSFTNGFLTVQAILTVGI